MLFGYPQIIALADQFIGFIIYYLEFVNSALVTFSYFDSMEMRLMQFYKGVTYIFLEVSLF